MVMTVVTSNCGGKVESDCPGKQNLFHTRIISGLLMCTHNKGQMWGVRGEREKKM